MDCREPVSTWPLMSVAVGSESAFAGEVSVNTLDPMTAEPPLPANVQLTLLLKLS